MTDATRPVSPSPIELERLLGIADRDLTQAQMGDLHPDTKFLLAYNAALQLATIVLRLHGVRVRKAAFHARTFAELKTRLPEDLRGVADYLDRARRKRNEAAYEQANVVSESEVEDLIEQTRSFREWVVRKLREDGFDIVDR